MIHNTRTLLKMIGFFVDDDYDASFDQQVDKLREENQMSNTDSDDDWSCPIEPPPAQKR